MKIRQEAISKKIKLQSPNGHEIIVILDYTDRSFTLRGDTEDDYIDFEGVSNFDYVNDIAYLIKAAPEIVQKEFDEYCTNEPDPESIL